jgi:hypothetical protein
MLRITAICLLLAFLSQATLAQTVDGADPTIVTLRSTTYPIDKYYVCLVAKSAFGERVWMQQGESISSRIRKKCGHEDKDYIEIFQSIDTNRRSRVVTAGGALVANTDAYYVFPECLHAQDWQRGVEGEAPPTLTVKRQMSVAEIVEEYVGPRDKAKKNEAIKAIYRDNPEAVPRLEGRDPPGDRIANLSVAPNSQIKLDVLLQPRDIKLDLSVTSRAEFISQLFTATDSAAFRQFNKCATSDVFRVPLEPIPFQELFTQRGLRFGGAFRPATTPSEEAASARLSAAERLPPHQVDFCAARTVEPLPENVQRCDGTVTDEYPVNWPIVAKIIALEDTYKSDRKIPAIILTDTGLQGLDDVLTSNSSSFPDKFPSDVFLRIRPDASNNAEAIGINYSKRSDRRFLPPFYHSGQPDKDHGTHIAGIVLGQVGRGDTADKEDADRLALLRKRLRIFVLNVVKNDKSTDRCNREYYISPSDIGLSIAEIDALTRQAGLRIFNMSLETYETIQRPLGSDQNLIVAAAGNAGIDYARADRIALTEVYPAHWSSSLNNVISVGGHDATRQLAIGNTGSDEVHIAAPACKIHSLVGIEDGAWRKGEMTGTSQAAAHVTLAAALVHHLHAMTPDDIRWRLIDAADFEPALESANFAGGALNIGASLGARFDVVKLRQRNEVLFGRITQEKLWGCPSASSRAPSAQPVLAQTGNLRRVSYLFEGADPSEVRMLWGKRRDLKGCSASDDMRRDFAGSHLEFEEAVIVNEDGQDKVAFKKRPIPLSDIREIVPSFHEATPAGPLLPN